MYPCLLETTGPSNYLNIILQGIADKHQWSQGKTIKTENGNTVQLSQAIVLPWHHKNLCCICIHIPIGQISFPLNKEDSKAEKFRVIKSTLMFMTETVLKAALGEH